MLTVPMDSTTPHPASASGRPLPLMVDLAGRTCLVAGGGDVATRRVEALVEAGASVRLVAPRIVPRLAEHVACGDVVEWHRRGHQSGDAVGCALVVAATDDAAVNDAVGRDAARNGALCNRADRPEDGDVVVPAVVRRGDLVIAISTAGSSPSLAGVIRRELEERFGPEWADLTDLLGDLRQELRAGHDEPEGRRDAIQRMIDDDVLGALAAEDHDLARRIAQRALGGGGQ